MVDTIKGLVYYIETYICVYNIKHALCPQEIIRRHKSANVQNRLGNTHMLRPSKPQTLVLNTFLKVLFGEIQEKVIDHPLKPFKRFKPIVFGNRLYAVFRKQPLHV